MKKVVLVAEGFLIGIINSTLGAGGGMLAVPLLRRTGLCQSDSQVNSLAVIFPLSLVSAYLYIRTGRVAFAQAVPYLLPGALGTMLGIGLLKKIPDTVLRKIFGAFMLWAGIRMVMR